MSTRNNKKNPKMYDYGMDYEGTVSDPMDGVIAAALRATGQKYARLTGKDMQTDRISVTDAGAGLRVFMPTDAAVDKGVLAISLDLEVDEKN
jgi:hypothetical protein